MEDSSFDNQKGTNDVYPSYGAQPPTPPLLKRSLSPSHHQRQHPGAPIDFVDYSQPGKMGNALAEDSSMDSHQHSLHGGHAASQGGRYIPDHRQAEHATQSQIVHQSNSYPHYAPQPRAGYATLNEHIQHQPAGQQPPAEASTSTPTAEPPPVTATKSTKKTRGRPRKSAGDQASGSTSAPRPKKRRISKAKDEDDGADDDDDEAASLSASRTTKSGRNVKKPETFTPNTEPSFRRRHRAGQPKQTSSTASPAPTPAPLDASMSASTDLIAQAGQAMQVDMNAFYCRVCTSGESPDDNQIVLCDGCDIAYHQRCHIPIIPPEVVRELDSKWFCAACERQGRADRSRDDQRQDVPDSQAHLGASTQATNRASAYREGEQEEGSQVRISDDTSPELDVGISEDQVFPLLEWHQGVPASSHNPVETLQKEWLESLPRRNLLHIVNLLVARYPGATIFPRDLMITINNIRAYQEQEEEKAELLEKQKQKRREPEQQRQIADGDEDFLDDTADAVSDAEGGPPEESYFEMLRAALNDLNEPEGVAPRVLYDYIAQRHKLPRNFRPSAGQALQKAAKKGHFLRSGSMYRINPEYADMEPILRPLRKGKGGEQVKSSRLEAGSPRKMEALQQSREVQPSTDRPHSGIGQTAETHQSQAIAYPEIQRHPSESGPARSPMPAISSGSNGGPAHPDPSLSTSTMSTDVAQTPTTASSIGPSTAATSLPGYEAEKDSQLHSPHLRGAGGTAAAARPGFPMRYEQTEHTAQYRHRPSYSYGEPIYSPPAAYQHHQYQQQQQWPNQQHHLYPQEARTSQLGHRPSHSLSQSTSPALTPYDGRSWSASNAPPHAYLPQHQQQQQQAQRDGRPPSQSEMRRISSSSQTATTYSYPPHQLPSMRSPNLSGMGYAGEADAGPPQMSPRLSAASGASQQQQHAQSYAHPPRPVQSPVLPAIYDQQHQQQQQQQYLGRSNSLHSSYGYGGASHPASPASSYAGSGYGQQQQQQQPPQSLHQQPQHPQARPYPYYGSAPARHGQQGHMQQER